MDQELKQVLMREHARDKKLTYLSFGLLLLVIVVVAALLMTVLRPFLLSFIDGMSDTPLYPKLALGAALIGYIIYVISRLSKLATRGREIDEMIEKVEAGAKAATITNFKEYRITIPLGKITYKMCPVHFQKFCLDNAPNKYYTIPVHPAYEPEFKTFLSGADGAKINERLQELYSEQTPESSVYDDTPLKSMEDFRTFLQEELSEDVNQLDQQRKSANKGKKVGMAIGLIMAACVMGWVIFNNMNPSPDADQQASLMKTYLPVLGLFAAFYIIYFLFLKPKGDQTNTAYSANTVGFEFKNKVLSKVIKFVNPDTEYAMHSHVGYNEIMESGMFSDVNYQLEGNDLVIGRYKGVPYQFCYLRANVQKRKTKEGEEPPVAFAGPFFVARFNKAFSSPVYLIPKTKGLFGKSEEHGYLHGTGDKVTLEDPEFMDMFNVYATDQIEARYILTPALMERIKKLVKDSDGIYYISFNNKLVTIANNSGKAPFYVKDNQSLVDNDYAAVTSYYDNLCNQLGTIDDLKLNVKIWN